MKKVFKVNRKSTGKTNQRRAQRHTHEFLGSLKLAEMGIDRHNHRFAGVTGQAIPRGRSHVHVISTNTDFFGHFHQVKIVTGPAIPIGNGKHIHFVKGQTTLVDGHLHRFAFATLIENPLT
ncbi:YmaF-like protein [Aneurinibacillus soli]|uniref:YmaF family protein n=1 Tax=Aneurinibacillus soli TaxID=1500254 RepID=A0A0U5C510_9BACL|nr:YmaF family protein [Aneurinibacillus soli]PYE57932.1 YmaF-like protein [Aneurinibacillus soli]BAU26883.1 YmaF family protein [Aneurinibacillus soli]